MQMVVEGQKTTLTAERTKDISVPLYPEFTTEFALQCCLTDKNCWRYVPDSWQNKKQKRSRTFLFKVLLAERPDYMKSLIHNAQKVRDPDVDKEELGA